LAPRHGYAHVALLVASAVFVGCRSRCSIPDADRDGTIRIACLGDSRTDAHFDPNIPSWCERLPTLRPTQKCSGKALPLTTRNYAVSGTEVTVVAFQQEARALAPPTADALVVAFGVNDLYLGATVEEVIVMYKALIRKGQGRPVFIATTPPAYLGESDNAKRLNKSIERLNETVRSTFPASRVVDFDTGFTADLYIWDGLHGSNAMEALMASRVADALDR